MAENNFKELSPCGALIMKIVWEAPGEISVQELIDQLNEKYQGLCKNNSCNILK